jgi:hypothetical protein
VDFLVELRGFEPVISAMRHPRALDGVPLPTGNGVFCALAPILEPALSTERLEVCRKDIVLPHMIQGHRQVND